METVKSLKALGQFGNDLENWTNFWDGWTYVLIEQGKSASNIQAHLDKIYQEQEQ